MTWRELIELVKGDLDSQIIFHTEHADTFSVEVYYYSAVRGRYVIGGKEIEQPKGMESVPYMLYVREDSDGWVTDPCEQFCNLPSVMEEYARTIYQCGDSLDVQLRLGRSVLESYSCGEGENIGPFRLEIKFTKEDKFAVYDGDVDPRELFETLRPYNSLFLRLYHGDILIDHFERT